MRLKPTGTKAHLLEACQEGEYAYEYRHGATSYGAFTNSLVNIFRQAARSGKGLSWEVLKRRVGKRLRNWLSAGAGVDPAGEAKASAGVGEDVVKIWLTFENYECDVKTMFWSFVFLEGIYGGLLRLAGFRSSAI
jgi:hypothetical protein